jgi:hypothetical protein
MEEILPGLYHWTTFHEGIQEDVHSYLFAEIEPAVVIDPRVPPEGMDWFDGVARPAHAYLTNRHHYRHSGELAKVFGTRIWCHRAGMHELTHGEQVTPFEHGDRLPGGIDALEVGVLCPEETAFYVRQYGGILALGDAIVRRGDALAFVPDELMGEDPAGVKRGLRAVFLGHLARELDHLLLAHGAPWIGGAKAGLKRFLETISA